MMTEIVTFKLKPGIEEVLFKKASPISLIILLLRKMALLK